MLTSVSIVIIIEAPFLSIFISGHMVFNQAVERYHKDFVAQPLDYWLSLGSGLIPLFFIGIADLKNMFKNLEGFNFSLLFFWNLVIVAVSFLPMFGVRAPGWRVLLLIPTPLVATLGFANFFSMKNFITPKKLLTLIILIIVSSTVVIVNQNERYKPWISEGDFNKLKWISENQKNSSCIFVLCLNYSEHTYDYAKFYRNWIWAIIGSRTYVYFGDFHSLLQGKPTEFDDPYLNWTSYIFYQELDSSILEGVNIYLIKDLYDLSLDNETLNQVAPGIYCLKYQNVETLFKEGF